MIKQQSAGIIVFLEKNHERYYLILKYMGGHWDFAKGKSEEGETLLDAAHRELKEETGLTAQIEPGFQESLSYIFKERGKTIEKTVTFFVGQTNQERVALSREHVGYLWLPFDQALKRLTYTNAQDVLTKADSFLSALPKQ